MQKFTFIDLFAGIGGFHIAMHNLGAQCIFVSEFDKSYRMPYYNNFKDISSDLFLDNKEDKYFAKDIT